MPCGCCDTDLSKSSASIPVRFAPVTHGNDVNQFTQRVERVHHTVVADADAPEILATLEFLTSSWARLGRERFNLRENSFDQLRREFLEFLAG